MSRNARMYVRADLVAVSPIKLSSGLDEASDADVLVDATGTPFIPGTSLAGVMRHYVQAVCKQAGKADSDYVNTWFGFIVKHEDKGEQSRICVHDAFAIKGAKIGMRDGVRLNEHKTTDGTGKYDYQVVEDGARFELRLELLYDAASEKKEAEGLVSTLVNGLSAGEIQVGGKTSRGFGKLGISNVRYLVLDLDEPKDVQRYIDFAWDSKEFDPFRAKSKPQSLYEKPVEVKLAVVSSLMIRDYATVERSGYENKLVDSQMLEGANGNPIIPGTTWAGAFRHHMARILRLSGYDAAKQKEGAAEEFLSCVFGNVDGSRGTASKIEFSQSELQGAERINLTRTAIDRFTGGAANEKLFTNRLAFGGTTILRIRWRKELCEEDDANAGLNDEYKSLLRSLVNVCVADLCDGTLAVGGMTATGSGMFRKASSKNAGVTA